MTLNLGIDVGGTFTDLFLYDSQSTRSWSAKTPTTPANQAVGVMTGVLEVCARAGVAPASLDAVLHGTTVTTNALLEGKGSRVGLLTSYGWRNILHLADSWTPGPLFGFSSYTPPEPVVPHERIRELQERVAADGEVILALSDADVEERVNELLATGIEALTICLHHSYAFPEHEQRAGAVARRVLERAGSTIPVSLSSQVSPEFREYERTVTTVLNSYLGPVMRRYLSSLESALGRVPVAASLQVVRSDGGLMSVGAAQEHPVSTALSGPSSPAGPASTGSSPSTWGARRRTSRCAGTGSRPSRGRRGWRPSPCVLRPSAWRRSEPGAGRSPTCPR
jgi:N-methylhydantoinase A